MDLNSILSVLQTHLDVVVTVIGAAVAVISALFARGETKRQRHIQTETLRQSIDTASLEWGNHAIDTLGKAAMFSRSRHLQANEDAFIGAKTQMLIGLSALVERGRMFFPNVDPDSRGAEKDGAYRGSRPPILDAIMYAYYELQALTREGGPTGDNSADFIEDCRRLMVSELQAHLDPRRRDAIIGRYDKQKDDHRSDALKRSGELKLRLQTRRPAAIIDGERPVNAPASETVQ